MYTTRRVSRRPSLFSHMRGRRGTDPKGVTLHFITSSDEAAGVVTDPGTKPDIEPDRGYEAIQRQPMPTDPEIKPDIELLRMRDLLARIPMSRSTLWRRIRANQFPRAQRLGGPNSRLIAWRSDEVEAWIQDLTAV